MTIPLTQFESHIDEKILERGYTYFMAGKVQSPEETGPGEFLYMVEGTEEYQVLVTIENGVLVEQFCNCPYDRGPVCKHLVAALFDLQKDELGLEVPKKSTRKSTASKPARKSKTVAEQVDELLQKASREELEGFIREQASRERNFRDLVIASFAHHSEKQSKSLYTKQLKSAIRSASGRSGFIDWTAAVEIGRTAEDLLEKAIEHKNTGNYKLVFYICTATLEQLTKALEHTDDSSGAIGANITAALELFNELAIEVDKEGLRKQLLKYCLSAYEKKTYRGWDWHFEMLTIAEELIKTQKETDWLFELVNRPAPFAYRQEQLDVIKYRLLVKSKGEAFATDFLEQHLENPGLRRMALEQALENKNYDIVVSLASDGLAQDSESLPGLANEWQRWLLQVAQLQQDIPAIIEHARQLFLGDLMGGQDYYQLLKDHTPPENWKDFVEALILDARKEDPWDSYGLLPNIFIKEEYWDRLLDLLKERTWIYDLDRFSKYFPEFPHEDVMDLYRHTILKYLSEKVGRTHYKEACRYLRRMRKMGGNEEVEAFIAELRVRFSPRRALLEELETV